MELPSSYRAQSAADTPMAPSEEDALRQHGLKSSALGDNCPTWLKKFAAMQVRNWSVGAPRRERIKREIERQKRWLISFVE